MPYIQKKSIMFKGITSMSRPKWFRGCLVGDLRDMPEKNTCLRGNRESRVLCLARLAWCCLVGAWALECIRKLPMGLVWTSFDLLLCFSCPAWVRRPILEAWAPASYTLDSQARLACSVHRQQPNKIRTVPWHRSSQATQHQDANQTAPSSAIKNSGITF